MGTKGLSESLFGGGRKMKAGFLAAIVALAASIMVIIYPARTDAILTIAGFVSAVIMVLIGGISFEDAMTKWAARPRYSADFAGLLAQLQAAVAELETAKQPPALPEPLPELDFSDDGKGVG